MTLSRRRKRLLKDGFYRAARTWLQTFLAVLSANGVLDLHAGTLKAAAVSGLSAVIAFVQRQLDDAVPTVPPNA